MARVIGVLGGSGGVGASTFTAALAAVAGPSLIVDLDAAGGGIDVLLGLHDTGGARWSSVRLAGGRLDPDALLGGLPHWGRCAVLAADGPAPDADAVRQVLAAAASAPALRSVILDLPRADCAERAAGLLRCDFLVVLARADWPGLVAAHALVAALPDLPTGLVLRRGPVPAPEAARCIAAPLVGRLPGLGAPGVVLDPHRLPRTAGRVAAGVLDGMRAP